jgi:hypothetical protein
MAKQKKKEKSIDVKVEDVKDVEEIVEQTEEEVVNDEDVINDEEVIEDVEEDEVEEVNLTQRQLLCKWELQRLVTIYGLNDFEKVVKMMLK